MDALAATLPSSAFALLHMLQASRSHAPTATPQVAPKSADLASFAAAGASLEEQITAAVAACPITVFVKPSCPFCVEVQRTFEALGAPCATFDVGATSGLHAALKKMTGQTTVPYVFIGKVGSIAFPGAPRLPPCGAAHALLVNGAPAP
jgi:glutaredoxin